MFGIKWFQPERLSAEQLWPEGDRRGLCCSSLPLDQLAPSSRIKDAEARTETERGALVIFALLIFIFAEVPVFIYLFIFVTLISLWPIADCGGRNEPGLAGPSCFLPGTGGGAFIPSSDGLEYNAPNM